MDIFIPDTRRLLETLQFLLADRIAEIEDFVALIAAREQEPAVSRAAMGSPAPFATYDAI